MQDEVFVTCKCTSLDHVARVIYEPDDNEIYFTMHLAPLPFRKRLWNAIRYLFGFRSKYGDFEEVLVTPESAFGVLELFTRFGEDYLAARKREREASDSEKEDAA